MNKPKRPLQIGVTGGIGSGKSIVCKLFACLGIPVYDADSKAKVIIENSPAVRGKVEKLLGVQAYRADGRYDRVYVASLVFQNPELLKNLNAIVHPAVLADTFEWAEKNSDSPYVVKEAAIMKKAGEGNSLDYVIVVDAPAELRIQRILKRDKRTEKEIRDIIARQISDEERDKIADFIVRNDEDTALIPQILALHERFNKQLF